MASAEVMEALGSQNTSTRERDRPGGGTEDGGGWSWLKIPEELDRHCPDWLAGPLVDISRPEAIDRHRAIVAKSGRWVAHRVMAQLRACWNSARERFGELPEHPFRIKRRKKLRRRREPIP